MKFVKYMSSHSVQAKLSKLSFYKFCRKLVKFQMQLLVPVKVNLTIVALVKVQTPYDESFYVKLM